jgi:hypothetical protein
MSRSSRKTGPARGGAPRFVSAIGAANAILFVALSATAQDAQPLVDASMVRSPGLPVLQARPTGGDWATACVLPCQLHLSTAAEYRISGEGVVDSDPFRLPLASKVRVDATGGSSMLHGVATLLTVGGLVFAAGGAAILLVPNDPHASDDARTSKVVVGSGFLAMGLLSTAIGILARAFSDTSVRVAVAP